MAQARLHQPRFGLLSKAGAAEATKMVTADLGLGPDRPVLVCHLLRGFVRLLPHYALHPWAVRLLGIPMVANAFANIRQFRMGRLDSPSSSCLRTGLSLSP